MIEGGGRYIFPNYKNKRQKKEISIILVFDTTTATRQNPTAN